MFLVSELAQPIVDKTIAIIKKNVNIMDDKAIIIASGDPSLIGVFHEGAYLVIGQGKPIEVYPDGVGSLKGVIRPGVNLPIVLNGKTVGVVGVSGHPDEIRSNVELVKVMVESMLEQIILKEQFDLEARANESFLSDLLTEKAVNHEDLFINRAGILGYDISTPRFAIVIDIDNFRETVEKKTACQGDIRGELAIQQLKEKVLWCLKQAAVTKGSGIVVFVGGDEFVILQSCEAPLEDGQHRREITAALEALRAAVNHETGLAITIGVGTRYPRFQDYYRSFREGRNAIKIGQCLEGRGRVFWIDDLLLENLIASVPEAVLKSYVERVLGKIIHRESPNAQKELFKTVEALCNNTLNPTKAAREMFIHRNTVLFRLEKLCKEAGYQPAESFADAAELKLALLAQKLLKAGISPKGS